MTTAHLGVFGGTFDPIHIGHLIVAQEVSERLGLERVLFVPARVSPLKRGRTLFTAEQRYEMVSAAIADDPRFEPSAVDLQRPAPSFTTDTLRLIAAQQPSDAVLHFIMGIDSLLTFAYWHRPDEIIALARLAVISRPGYVVDIEELDRAVPGLAGAIDLIETVQVGISSADIRRRLRQGQAVRYLVAEPAWKLLVSLTEAQA